MTTVSISTTTADLYGRAVGPVLDNSGASLEFGRIATDPCKVWIPFVVPALPKAKIATATLKLVAATNRSGTTCKIKIGCVAVDNASAPATWAALDGLSLTTAYTTDNNVAAMTAGVEYTWDIKTAVQEIVNRAGWVAGNTLAVLIVDNTADSATQRTMASYDNVTYAEPILDLVYYNGGSVTIWSNE